MLILVGILLVALAGCERKSLSSSRSEDKGPQSSSVEAAASATEPSPATEPSASDLSNELLAYVNDQPVYMDDLYEMLLESYGLTLSQQVIANHLVRQAGIEQSVSVSPEDIRKENENTLNQMFPGIQDPNQREHLLDQLLVRRDVTLNQWNKTMWRNAMLDKLARVDLKVEDAEIRNEFGELYGRKYVVRHIQTASLSEAQEVLDRLRDGENFVKLAKEVSKNPSGAEGGLLPPIGPKAEGLPFAMREVARSMKEIGEISAPIQTGTAFHILYLEEIIEPQDVDFESVREELADTVYQKKLSLLKQKILADMIRQAKIEYVNPILKEASEKTQEGNTP
jgi:foldase protein PrsA